MPAPSCRIDDDHLALSRNAHLVPAVEVHIRGPRRPQPAGLASASVLRGDELRHSRGANVGQVDAAEQAVPVESFDWPRYRWSRADPASRPAAIASTFSETRSICLWRSLTSRYFTWKFRQSAPRSQRASGAPVSSGRDATHP